MGVDMTTPTTTPKHNPLHDTQVCKRCGGVYPLYSERCTHCGKDSKYGTQSLGLLVTLGMLMFALPLAVVLIFIFW